jgi:cell wall-associated NlpC family hydrolase
MFRRFAVALVLAALVAVLPARARAGSPTGGAAYTSTSSPPGGTAAQAQASPGAPVPTATSTTPASTTAPAGTTVPVPVATVGADGLAVAPAGAPAQVVALIAAGNQIATTPYRYGGGHGSFEDTAYDCSGSVSFALHGAQLVDATLDSTALTRWGRAGAGRWITVYANKTHTYLVVAGLRFDTSGQKAAGTRWQAAPRSGRGFKVRHPAGL